MNPLRSLPLLLVAVVLSAGLLSRAGAEPATAADPAGHWEGQITLPTTTLLIHVDLARAGEVWGGTIDIPAQGLRGFELLPIKVDGTNVQFSMPKIPGDPAFNGQWDQAAGTIVGAFAQNGLVFPFQLTRRAAPPRGADEPPARGFPGEGIAGHWQGALQPSPIMRMRLALEISRTAEGKYEGGLISLDQDGSRIPISAVTETAEKVTLTVARVGGTFEGRLNADGSEFGGEWHQNGAKLPLLFKRVEKAAVTGRPQDPAKPYPYLEEEVTVPNDAAGVQLAGTLTRPPGAGPFPAVVLITGSGPQDRNESLMGHRPFLVLADYLTRAGFAVLRCDDRGVNGSTGDFTKAVLADFVTDALAGVTWLRGRAEIDPRRIGLLGHSEGGMVAPLAVGKNPRDIAFIVLLAGVGVPVQELLIRQAQDLQRAAGGSEAAMAKNATAQHEIFAMLHETPAATDDATVEKKVRAIIEAQLTEFTPEQRRAMGLTETMVSSQSKMIASRWFRDMITYDPRPVLRAVKCPVLAINGARDRQVSAKENLAGIRDALAAGGNADVKIEELPGLNHLFQTCTTGGVSEYGEIAETMAPAALELIAGWLREHTAARP